MKTRGSHSVLMWATVIILVGAWLLGWLYNPGLGFLLHLVLVLAIIVISKSAAPTEWTWTPHNEHVCKDN